MSSNIEQPVSRILIAGTGPAAVQLGVLMGSVSGTVIGLAGRPSRRSAQFFTALNAHNRTLQVRVQNKTHRAASGSRHVDHIFTTYDSVTADWDLLVLSVSADAYVPVLQDLSDDVLHRLVGVVLVSPTLGSHALVARVLRDRGAKAQIVSCSSYLGDTRFDDPTPSPRVLTAGVKRTLHLGSTSSGSALTDFLRSRHESLGITVAVAGRPIDAEARNISLYVHPPLFMNDVTLESVFDPPPAPKYVYKLFPEGPVTPALIRSMVAQWRELTALINALGGTGVNLLRFMLQESYPLRPESIDAADVDAFEALDDIHQEYLIYVRYASLLIDPYSTPDRDGRYFDFSAIPIRSVFLDETGTWQIPRMPREDYYRTKVIRGIARHLNLPCPTVDGFLTTYERHLSAAAAARTGSRLSKDFTTENFDDHVRMICAGLPETS